MVVKKIFPILRISALCFSLFISACGKLTPEPQSGIVPIPDDRSGLAVAATNMQTGELTSCPEFYTEEFNGSTTESCWISNPPLIVTSAKPDQVRLLTQEEGLNLVIDAAQTDAYVFYRGGLYPDLNLQATITSRGVNNHAAALVCRANEKGWYEARVSTSGFFSIYRYDTQKRTSNKNPYTDFIMNTPSAAINTGTDKTNVIQFLCIGNNLILNINGTEVFNRSLADKTDPGLVGIGGHSQENFPVDLTFQTVLIGPP
jgi:hypothetical protein